MPNTEQTDLIKEAFAKAKQDISELKDYLYYLYQEIDEIKQTIQTLSESKSQQTNQQTGTSALQMTFQQTESLQNQPIQQINPTGNITPTDNLPLYALKSQNMPFSTGNEGVPTDRQTNQQTNQHTGNKGVSPIQTLKNTPNNIQKVSKLLDTLDEIKKEVRIKFKHLTSQEMLIFSTIYQLEELGFSVDYPLLAKKLSLTESSIRDYTQRLIKKGIPLEKTRENNKKIFISISKDLKKIATLSTIIQLREL
jgi:DNA-binding MarR family transcriptional regulator